MSDNPYQPPSATLEVAQPQREFVLADRWARLGAVLLDGLLGFAIMLPLVIGGLWYAGVFSGSMSFFQQWMALMKGPGQYLVQLGMTVVGFVLFLAVQGWPLAQYGQTWGKRWLGIRIVDLEGRKPEFVRMIALRYGVGQVATQLPCINIVYGLTDTLMIFREDRRCLHDFMAGTRVVQGSPEA
jgi:uncharacterized RDD family membrane protein YckC